MDYTRVFPQNFSAKPSSIDTPSLGCHLENNKRIIIESLLEETHRHIICYPGTSIEECESRLKEIAKLDIDTIEFSGRKHINNTPVLGKGHVGIVVKAYKGEEKAALKIRRTDANRLTMNHEAMMLKMANQINVGPRLLGVTKNFLLMEYIEGVLLPEWITTMKRKNVKKRIQQVLRLVMEDAWRLDKGRLDHGELSHAPKHIIVKPENVPCIVDFGTSSLSRRVSNVTSLCQYLFIGSQLAKWIQKYLGGIDVDGLIESLRTYKRCKDRRKFEAIILKCGVL